jgi:hypothetical protein
MRHGAGDRRGAKSSFLGLKPPLKAIGIGALVVALSLLAAPAASAESKHQLDALLSLVGGCEKPEALDPVEDPGCPTTPPASAHPAALFAAPESVTTDFYGNMYVSSFGRLTNGTQGRIDIFDPNGVFISELKIASPTSMAADSKGNLYVIAERESAPVQRKLLRYPPSGTYDPAAGEIAYDPETFTTLEQPGTTAGSNYTGIAVNVANDHIFANYGAGGLVEYNSAEEGNAVVSNTSMAIWPSGVGVAVDAARERVYATAADDRIDIFALDKPSGTPPNVEYEKIGSIEASAVPAKEFGGRLAVAVDEGNGNVFVLDGQSNVVYEFGPDGAYIETIEHSFEVVFGEHSAWIGVDNGPFSPNGKLSDKGRYLFVPSGKVGIGHSFAFYEATQGPPEVKSVDATSITENEAEFQAVVNPGNLETSYTFEYTTQESFNQQGWAGATVAGSGQIPAGNLDDQASLAVSGLEAGVPYRFRIVVSNEEASDEMEGTFSTYPSQPIESGPPCPNQMLRIGFSALLPDCRAYELVTPADTNGRAPLGAGHEGYFTTRQVSPAGDAVPFRVEGGSIPGIGGTGSYLGDPYVSRRTATGWTTGYIGPTGAEALTVMPGGTSPDQGYSFWHAERGGSAVVELEGVKNPSTSYLRFPDGHSEILGKGSIGTDYEASGLLIGENGEHVIFATGYGAVSSDKAVQIEPDAAPPTEEEKEGKVVKKGTRAIYDRTLDGTVHVVSLLPGDVPFGAGESVLYEGSSLDGRGVAFSFGTTLYLRYNNSETFEIGDGVEYAGVAEGGNRIFYLEGGRLWRFDAMSEARTPFSSGPVVPVNVSADGSAAYFISTSKLISEPNPNGAFPKAGRQNLYLAKEADDGSGEVEISFVGSVTERDVTGTSGTSEQVDGLGLWTDAASEPLSGKFAIDPSRSDLNGSVLLFQSRAPLTGYDPKGHVEVYRYDSLDGQLQCLSCNPTSASATSDATLQSESREGFALFFPQVWIQNLRPDGRRAIFQSMEALVPGDTDGRQDVYEWEDQGVGSCVREGGCVYLLSSGHSSRNDYLWAVSESGDDVFILTADLLLPADHDETPSIYDARVGGGFQETATAECEGEGCRPQLIPAPGFPAAQTPVHGAGDNVRPKRCGKGKRKVRRGGKVRCVKKHRKHHHRRAGSDRKGGHQ